MKFLVGLLGIVFSLFCALGCFDDSGSATTPNQPTDETERNNTRDMSRLESDMMSSLDVGVVENACGNGRIDEGEECDEDETDCVDCEVVATEIAGSGRYSGHFQAGSFDDFTLRVDGTFTLTLRTTSESDDCVADTRVQITGPGIATPVSNEDQDSTAACPYLQVEVVSGVYAVRVEAGAGRTAQTDVDYILVVELDLPCTPGVGDCPGLCERDNGGCANNADCRVEDETVICECRDGYVGNGRRCTREPCSLNEYVEGNACMPCAEGSSNAPGDNPALEDTVCDGCLKPAHIVINEIDYDQPSRDVSEFIELFNPTDDAIDLSTYQVVVNNGDTTPIGASYGELTLSGSLGSGAYAVVTTRASTALEVPPGVLVFQADFRLQNGASDAVLLVNVASGMPELVDAVVYEGNLDVVYLGDDTPIELGTQGESVGLDDNDSISLIRKTNGYVCDTNSSTEDWHPSPTPSPGFANITTYIPCDENEFVEANTCTPCRPGTTNESGDNAVGPNTACDVTRCALNEFVSANACEACAEGTTNAGGDDASAADTTCDGTGCKVNEYVSDNACLPCAPGTENASGDDALGSETQCDPIVCGANEYVLSHVCEACPAGTTNEAGDTASGSDTQCDPTLCEANEFVSANVCVACGVGTQNAADDDASGVDTSCDPIVCLADEYVSNNACVPCAPGTSNAAGDLATGEDTMCEEVRCESDYFVANNACVPCPPGTVNDAGDGAIGEDTACDTIFCLNNEFVSNHACEPCPQDVVNGFGDDASGANTVCDSCAEPLHLIITEFDADQESTDDGEFIELYNPTSDQLDLSAYQLILSSGDGTTSGTVYGSFSLSGILGSGDYALVLTKNSANVSPPLDVLTLSADLRLQNGPDAIALLDVSGQTPSVVDAVVYGGEFTAMLRLDDMVIELGTDVQNVGNEGPLSSLARRQDVQYCDSDMPSADWQTSAMPTPGSMNIFQMIPCGSNEYVSGNACVACAVGTTNAAGDNAAGLDTRCEPIACPAHTFVQANTCVPCEDGTTNLPGDDASGADTICDGTTCAENQYVLNNRCEPCVSGTTNAAGDDALGDNTNCMPTLCAANESVREHVCQPCAAGTANDANDDASGEDTVCDLCSAPTQIVINELDYAQTTEAPQRFVELYNPTDENVDLTSYFVVLASGADGAEYARIELSGALNASQYALVTFTDENNFTVPQDTPIFATDTDIQIDGGGVVAILKRSEEDTLLVDAVVYEGTVESISLVDQTIIELGPKQGSIGQDTLDGVGALGRIILGDVCDRSLPSDDWLFSETPTPGEVNVF